jgi:hypothetical protein
MLDPHTALAAAAAPPVPVPAASRRRVLVVGGGGRLGSAVLESVLAEHRFDRVGVLAHPVAPEPAALAAFGADTALLVFDTERHANGREARFVHPQPAELLPQAQLLLAAGVRRLVVVVPHQPALLPGALRAGLATLDETAVAALGLSHLVFMRMAQAGGRAAAGSMLQRLALGLLSQLHWMLPQREQPLRAVQVARFVAELAVALGSAPPGTRVLGPEGLWDWSRPEGGAAWLQAWLGGRVLPVVPQPRARL